MPSATLSECLALLRQDARRLWDLANRIVTTGYALEARPIAADLDAVGDQVADALARLKNNST